MSQAPNEFWAQATQQFQDSLSSSWSKALQSFQTLDFGSMGQGTGANLPPIRFDAHKLQALQQQYMTEAMELFSHGLGDAQLGKDKRFADPAWAANPFSAYSAAVYLLNSRTLMGLAEAVEADAKTKNRIRFAVEPLAEDQAA